MPTATRTQIIDCPVDEAFATVTDLTTFPEWNPTTVSARKLSQGEIGEGTRFELAIRGFGRQEIELREFEHNRRVNLVPHSKKISGGHVWAFTPEGEKTRIDHELVMDPKGFFKVFGFMMGKMADKNLRDTANAVQEYLESAES